MAQWGSKLLFRRLKKRNFLKKIPCWIFFLTRQRHNLAKSRPSRNQSKINHWRNFRLLLVPLNRAVTARYPIPDETLKLTIVFVSGPGFVINCTEMRLIYADGKINDCVDVLRYHINEVYEANFPDMLSAICLI